MRTRFHIPLGVAPLSMALVLAAGTALANTQTFYDQTLVYGYTASSKSPNDTYAWVDVVGDTSFNTKKIQVIRSGGDLTIKIFTNYDLNTGTTDGENPVKSLFPMADIAFDLDGDMHFEYGVAMTTRDNFTRGSLYAVTDASGPTTSWQSSLDLYDGNGGLTIGGRYDNCVKDVDCKPSSEFDQTPPYIPVVKMTDASFVFDGTVIQELAGALPSDYEDPLQLDASLYVTTITLDGLLDDLPEWSGEFNLFFGTAWCANDSVWIEVSAVPAPAGLPVLLAAAGGLAFVARRRRRLA